MDINYTAIRHAEVLLLGSRSALPTWGGHGSSGSIEELVPRPGVVPADPENSPAR